MRTRDIGACSNAVRHIETSCGVAQVLAIVARPTASNRCPPIPRRTRARVPPP